LKTNRLLILWGVDGAKDTANHERGGAGCHGKKDACKIHHTEGHKEARGNDGSHVVGHACEKHRVLVQCAKYCVDLVGQEYEDDLQTQEQKEQDTLPVKQQMVKLG
jgi:hypothetical protein